MEVLKIMAQNRQVDFIAEYLHNNYTRWEQEPIVKWIVENMDEEFILSIYDKIEKMGEKAFAISEEMRNLLDDRTAPIQL